MGKSLLIGDITMINIGDTLTRRTKRMPNREALVETDSGRRFTYAQINARTNRLANALTGLRGESGGPYRHLTDERGGVC